MLKTKFRVTKCLCEVMKGQKEIRKCAITEDGKRHIIQEKDGKEYFTIDNPYSNNILWKHFIGRIGDAAKAINEDYADCILSGAHQTVFNSYDFPIVFIDRTIGEELHKKAKEGFKNVITKYIIRYGSKNSFGGYQSIDEFGTPCICTNKSPKTFATYEEAEEFANKFISKAKDLATKVIDNDNFKLLHDDSICDIVRDFAFDMIIETDDKNKYILYKGDIKKLPNIGYSIDQYIL